MESGNPPGLFITGTNTEVGKTYVAALIARALVRDGLRVGVYKPAASGCFVRGETLLSEDALILWEAAGRPGPLEEVCPQRFAAAVAPHVAARAEGKEIDRHLLRAGIEVWRERSDIVLVEGAGGLMSPMSDDDYVADLAADFEYPLIVVAANTLGVINQTLQTLITASAFGNGLEVAGVVLNDTNDGHDDASRASNLGELTSRCVPPVLAHLRFGADDFDEPVDWFALAGGEA